MKKIVPAYFRSSSSSTPCMTVCHTQIQGILQFITNRWSKLFSNFKSSKVNFKSHFSFDIKERIKEEASQFEKRETDFDRPNILFRETSPSKQVGQIVRNYYGIWVRKFIVAFKNGTGQTTITHTMHICYLLNFLLLLYAWAEPALWVNKRRLTSLFSPSKIAWDNHCLLLVLFKHVTFTLAGRAIWRWFNQFVPF